MSAVEGEVAILVAGERHSYPAPLGQSGAKLAREGERQVLLRAVSGNSGGARVTAAMAGIDDDDRPAGRAGLRHLHFADGGAELDRHLARACLAHQGAAVLLFAGGLSRYRSASVCRPERSRSQNDAGDTDRHARSRPRPLRPRCHGATYHPNVVNVQLLLDFSGSETPVAVAALVRRC